MNDQVFDVRRDAILRELEGAGIAYELVEHEPAATRELADAFVEGRDTVCTKTLFLVNRKRTASYVLVTEGDAPLDLKELAAALEESRLSFGSSERLAETLGLEPGIVSPFGLLLESAQGIPLLLDARLWDAPSISFHPGDNEATVLVPAPELRRLLGEHGVDVRAVEL